MMSNAEQIPTNGEEPVSILQEILGFLGGVATPDAWLDEARRHWRDGEYDTDVVAIELSEGATDLQTVATNWPSATVQLALL